MKVLYGFVGLRILLYYSLLRGNTADPHTWNLPSVTR
jgi:hypothetical protein